MGFFDEDNKRFEWTLAVVVAMLVIYVGSFFAIRSHNTFPCEEDGCWYELVNFPNGTLQTVYYPLIMWDKRLSRVRYVGDA